MIGGPVHVLGLRFCLYPTRPARAEEVGGDCTVTAKTSKRRGGAGDKDSSLSPSFTHSGSARDCGGALNFHKFSDNDLLILPAKSHLITKQPWQVGRYLYARGVGR